MDTRNTKRSKDSSTNCTESLVTTKKRTKKESNNKLKQEDVPIYYDIMNWTTGGGYGGTSYIRLKDKGSDYGTPLKEGDSVEVLWPTGEKSVHEIITIVEHDSFYCRDACTTFHDTNVWACIMINHNGADLNRVKINEIKGIKARIIDTTKPTHPICL